MNEIDRLISNVLHGEIEVILVPVFSNDGSKAPFYRLAFDSPLERMRRENAEANAKWEREHP